MNLKVFVNRTLNLKKIRYIGFDMDHTLVRYHAANFEGLAYEKIIEKLIAIKKYPETIKNLKFDYDRSVRGLVIDKKNGNILKLNRFGAIRGSAHGLKKIDFETQKQMYRSTYIDLGSGHYVAIDTSFSTAFCVLYGQLVEIKDEKPEYKLPIYEQIADDIEECLDEAHKDGSLKEAVAKDLPRYIVKNPETVQGLERFVKLEKKLFVLTNSDFHYTKLLLDYTLTPFLKNHKSWTELFEIVITKATKPRFFYDRLDFLRIDPKTGLMSNENSPLKSGIYQGGCAKTFTEDLNLAGDDILYIGDHIYADIVRLKKDCAWRTALVIEELEQEIQANAAVRSVDLEITKLMHDKEPIENELLEIVTIAKAEGKRADEKHLDKLQDQVSAIDKHISNLISKREVKFNKYWSEIMRVGNEESYFARQVEGYACIYMSKISDFLQCSPRTYFRARRQTMPHEDPL